MALQDDVRHLASVPALRGLEADALRLIAFSGETRILRAGDILFSRGDVSNCGFVLLTGAIGLDAGISGTALLTPPALIGATALVTDTIRPATAIAREPSSVLKISRDLFRRVLAEYPDSAVRLRQSLAGHLARLQADLVSTRKTLLSSS